MVNIRPISPNLQKIANEELEEVTDQIPEYLEHLREWLAIQPHVTSKSDDQLLVTFLRGCKYSLEKTKEKLESFYSLKTFAPEYFCNRDPFNPAIQKLAELGFYLKLPLCTTSLTQSVCLIRCNVCNEEDFLLEDIIKYCFMLCEVYLLEDDNTNIAGVCTVVDFLNFPLKYVLQLSPYTLKKLISIVAYSFPTRMKGMHIINASPVFEFIYSLAKTFIPYKLRDRVFVYSSENTEALYNKIPKAVLPIEYGGDNSSINEVIAETKLKLESYKEWFRDNEACGYSETLQASPTSTLNVLSTQESFKELAID